MSSPVVYEVVVRCELDTTDRLNEYMRNRHLPQILATGCFASIEFEQNSPDSFRTRYKADSQADLDRYLKEHTGEMREDFMAHFPSGIKAVERVNWNVLQTFQRQ
ncbi:hypothetical protein THRCLA_22665 [Thraustotheca clavata]|uniref:DUF4286 domain-containing protein n=1 Tax=Thraustotheca clavata TaxID=74557 RepID=A0A1V9YV79_9STRA|nr:hypothetical protein THRCLA_22665 [Thraustotheca clavata]